MLALALLLFAGSSTASADLADETALAEHFAPVLSVATDRDCTDGRVLSPDGHRHAARQQHRRAARAVGRDDLVKIGPSGEELADNLYDYHLDFPGDALDPGCGYVDWAQRVTEGSPPVAYAHVARQADAPQQLALQYWFFYAFNDWNNLHEGDWEMIQLNFDAPSAREALARKPTSVGYSQHEGAERASWGDDKLELVDGTHPVLHPADRLACRLLHLGPVPRGIRIAGRRLRRHARCRRPASARTSRRSRATPPRPAARSRGSPSRAAGASCSRPSSTARPART